MSNKTLKNNFKTTIKIITKIVNEWDPYCLLESGAPIDEFSSEINSIACQIKPNQTIDELSKIVLNVFGSAFGYEDFKIDECKKIAEKIINVINAQ